MFTANDIINLKEVV